MEDLCGVQGACALGAKLASGCLCWLGELTARWHVTKVEVPAKKKKVWPGEGSGWTGG